MKMKPRDSTMRRASARSYAKSRATSISRRKRGPPRRAELRPRHGPSPPPGRAGPAARRVASRCRRAAQSGRAAAGIPPGSCSASAAIGVRQEPSSTARQARSAVTRAAVGASSSGASNAAMAIVAGADLDADGALGRRPAASPPASGWPSPGRRGRAASARPAPAGWRRPRPPRAWRAACSTLPRSGTTWRSGRAMQRSGPGGAARRCRRRAPCGSVGEAVAASGEDSASRGSSRGSRQPMIRPGGSQVGMSFMRMDGAVDAAVEQRLLDLLGEQALAADLQQRAVLHPVAGGA